MHTYKVLNKQEFSNGNFSIVPIRMEDRYVIMQWRNDQIYHLRQNTRLTEEDQDRYFNTVVAGLFNQEQPNQILFSYLEGGECIGYGGFVHINWIDMNAEISFIMDTNLELNSFNAHWTSFLSLIEKVACVELNIHKIYVFAFDLRPHLYKVLETCNYFKDAVLKEHCFVDGSFKDVVVHSKLIS